MMSKIVMSAAHFAGNVVKYGCIFHCYFEYVSDFVCCSGPSMEPTLYTNNVLLTERISKRFNGLNRGDIIVSKNPTKPEQFICKRIVGLPGDKICIKPRINFNPFVNTKSIVTTDYDEEKHRDVSTYGPIITIDDKNEHEKSSHINNQELSMGTFQSKEIYVPKGMVWLEGDNSENSADSRMYGPVPMGLIQSRVVCKVWPPNEIKLLI